MLTSVKIKYPSLHFAVSILNTAKIKPKTILVHFFVCLKIPETAGIGAYLVTKQYLVVMTTKLKLEIDQLQFSFSKKLFE